MEEQALNRVKKMMKLESLPNGLTILRIIFAFLLLAIILYGKWILPPPSTLVGLIISPVWCFVSQVLRIFLMALLRAVSMFQAFLEKFLTRLLINC